MEHIPFPVRLEASVLAELQEMAELTGRTVEDLVSEALGDAIATHLRPLLLVLQMGKVGSTAILDALEATHRYEIFHIHHLDAELIDRLWAYHEKEGLAHPPNLVRSRRVMDWLRTRRRRVQIVSAVRDPVARNISAFYQNVTTFLTVENRVIRETPEEAAEIFLRRYPHDTPLVWFDKNIRPWFRFSIWDTPFDAARKRLIAGDRFARILIVRAEDDDEVRAQALMDFLGIPGIQLPKSNVGQSKYYSDHYRQMREALKLPDALLDRMYNSQMARHFYTENEREAFRQTWQGAPVRAHAGGGV